MKRPLKLCVVPIAATGALMIALAAPAFGSSANRVIVVGQGIGGVTIGETEAHVKRILGRPTAIRQTIWQYGSQPITIRLSFGAKKGPWKGLDFIQTTSSAYKTSNGISVASSLAELKKAYPKAHCKVFLPEQSCVLTSVFHGRGIETVFSWSNTQQPMEKIAVTTFV